MPQGSEVNPPEELFGVEWDKIIGLAIRDGLINAICTELLKTLGLAVQASYPNPNRILEEPEYSKGILKNWATRSLMLRIGR